MYNVVVVGVSGDGVIGNTVETLMDEGIEAILGLGRSMWTCVTRNFSSFSGTFTC